MGDIAAEKAASERSQHKVVPADILPPAKMLYSLMILSALRNHASRCSPLFKLLNAFSDGFLGRLYLVSDKEPAAIEPLKEQEENSRHQ